MRRFIDRPVWGLVLRVIPGHKSLVYRIEAQESHKSPEQVVFESLAETIGLSGEMFQQVVYISGRGFQIVAINRSEFDSPICIRDMANNKETNISLEELANLLENNSPSSVP
jgi:hypothetical protein